MPRLHLVPPLCLVLLSIADGQCAPPSWNTPLRYHIELTVDTRGAKRSNSPASVQLNLTQELITQGGAGSAGPDAIEVIAFDPQGNPRLFNSQRQGRARFLLPWRIERLYGLETVTLHFVLPDEKVDRYRVYFDSIDAAPARPAEPPGLVGDGDFFRHAFGRREIGAHHFDCFADLDQDGDLDLFQGGVEPFIHCYENTGASRFVDRGRLASGGRLFQLPMNPGNNRSWVVPHFFDWDGDGDEDFLPSFLDGPYRGQLVFFENVTTNKGAWEFADRGALKTVSGGLVAGGAQAGGWFPSITPVTDFDRQKDGRIDLILGNNNHCYLYRGRERDPGGGWQLEDAVAIQADGADIELFNPCFDLADVDGDGDQDLLAAPQSGQIHLYENEAGPDRTPRFAEGRIIAYDDRYLQRSTHPRVKVADFTGDGLPDFVVDRAWELTNLDRMNERDYGALFENTGTATQPSWSKRGARQGAPYTETFQICDAIRQNVVLAADWDTDGRADLLAGDCDGFVWWFRNTTDPLAPVFEPGRKLMAGGAVLSLAGSAGHARPAVCDWNNDGKKDLVCSDGAGTVTVYLNQGADAHPLLAAGQAVMEQTANGPRPIDRGTRSHLLVCDWNNDGKNDLIFSDQENPGFYFLPNIGEPSAPLFGPARGIGLKSYMRPNLGAFVDWDGDGLKDFIGCEFEHSIRFYKNHGTGQVGEVPRFEDLNGVTLLKPFSIMMISGAEVVDWNGDGDLDLLTGQGHGGSGLRFYERDYLEDLAKGTAPIVTVVR